MATQVDVIVIGLGPGGEAAAAKFAQAGLSTIGIEARLMGGECPYYGCIPSKMMVRAGNALAEGRRISSSALLTALHANAVAVTVAAQINSVEHSGNP